MLEAPSATRQQPRRSYEARHYYARRMCELQRLRSDHLDAVFAFELANRTYFAQCITDRGDDFFRRYAEHHRELLMEQDTGACIFHVLVDHDGAIVGRFNLYDLSNGSAVVGYRVAQQAAGRGVATSALRELSRLAQAEYGLRRLTAETHATHHASQRVLEKAGFSVAETCEVAGQPGIRYTLQLATVARVRTFPFPRTPSIQPGAAGRRPDFSFEPAEPKSSSPSPSPSPAPRAATERQSRRLPWSCRGDWMGADAIARLATDWPALGRLVRRHCAREPRAGA